MARMRQLVEERNIYRWAAKFITALAGTRAVNATPDKTPPESPGSLLETAL